MSQQLYQIQNCHNCKDRDAWLRGAKLRDRQEFRCFYCGAIVHTPLLKEDA